MRLPPFQTNSQTGRKAQAKPLGPFPKEELDQNTVPDKAPASRALV